MNFVDETMHKPFCSVQIFLENNFAFRGLSVEKIFGIEFLGILPNSTFVPTNFKVKLQDVGSSHSSRTFWFALNLLTLHL